MLMTDKYHCANISICKFKLLKSIIITKQEKGKIKMNSIIKEIEQGLMRKDLPQLNPGDTVKVFVRIKEGNKERTQAFEGVIIKMRGKGVNASITVRKVFQGIGVERVFLVHAPRIEKIKVLRRGDVRRAKLYYLRERTGKATRIKEKARTKVKK